MDKTMDEVIMAMPRVILSILTISGLMVTLFSLWGLLILVLAVIFLVVCLMKIPYRPPYVGLPVIWGRRLPIVKKEGWHLFAPIFPFLYTVTIIKVEKINLDFAFADIRTRAKGKRKKPRAGGELLVNISLTYCPDYKSDKAGERLITFINSGERTGVEDIIRDLIAEDIREMGREYSWEEVTFSTGELKKRLVKKLTGKELKKEAREREAQERELRTNGWPDVADLGIRISRFNIGRIKEQGELAKAAEAFAKEEQQRRGEEVEQRFVQKHTKKYIKMGISPGEAVDAVQVERGKAKKEVKAYRGLDKIAEAVGVGIASVITKKK